MTGAKIKESSLGAVPNATRAVSANQAFIFYASDTSPYWSWDAFSYDAEWTAIDPAGTMALYGVVNNGAHVLGSPCAFQVSWTSAG